MKRTVIIAFLVLISIIPAMAQKNVLVVENPGNTKNFKYYEGDKIEIMTVDSLSMKGLISSIRDSVFVLDFYTEVSLKKVAEVQRQRWALKLLSRVMLVGGIGLIALEAINGAISSSGNINNNTLYLGAGIAGAGALLIPLRKSHLTIGKDQWKIKILATDEKFNYQKNKTIQF